MSSRKALRRLIQQKPTPPEVERTMEALRKESDLGVAITGAALAEHGLEKLLIAKLKRRNGTLLNDLFQNRGPLTDFHSKILIAEAFGIITSPMAQEFHALKLVRNVFAHAKIQLTFDHQDITQVVSEMKMHSAVVDRLRPPRKPSSARTWYLLTVQILLIVVEGLEETGEGPDEMFARILKDAEQFG